MRVVRPEPVEDGALRQWFAEQEFQSPTRLDSGATALIQLVTGLYGVLFAILAFKDSPAYLQRLPVQVLGSASVGLYFLSLICAFWVVLPRRIVYQEDNISAMTRGYGRLVSRKVTWLRIALLGFLLGTACLGGVIVAMLWKV